MTHNERAVRRRFLVEAVGSGESVSEVAHRFGVSLTTVYSACRHLGQSRRLASQERKSQIAAAVAEGLNADEVASRFGVSLSLVWNSCQEHGVRRPRPVSASSLDIIARLFDPELTLQMIADKFGITRQAVSALHVRALRAGIPLPHRPTAGRRSVSRPEAINS